MNWLREIWEFLFGWPSVSILIGCAATAIAILEPPLVAKFIPNLRTVAIYAAVAAFSYTAVAGKYFNDGIAVKQAEWDAAISKEADRGEAARTDAVASVPAVTSDRSMFRGDPWNRNKQPNEQQPGGRAKSALRWLERY